MFKDKIEAKIDMAKKCIRCAKQNEPDKGIWLHNALNYLHEANVLLEKQENCSRHIHTC